MKILNLMLIALIALTILRQQKVLEINKLLLIGGFILWFIFTYIKIHLKNKDRNTPRPVYIAQ